MINHNLGLGRREYKWISSFKLPFSAGSLVTITQARVRQALPAAQNLIVTGGANSSDLLIFKEIMKLFRLKF